jgi:hypothetical protein
MVVAKLVNQKRICRHKSALVITEKHCRAGKRGMMRRAVPVLLQDTTTHVSRDYDYASDGLREHVYCRDTQLSQLHHRERKAC